MKTETQIENTKQLYSMFAAKPVLVDGTWTYAVTFNFTDKAGYLAFRTLWREWYKDASAEARAARASHIAYRNAGGYGRKATVGDLKEAEANLVHDFTGREERRKMMVVRMASKRWAQECYLKSKQVAVAQ